MAGVLNKVQRYLEDFTKLIYPSICMACAKKAPVRNEYLCFSCQATLPYTDLHLHKDNTFTDRLWGRFPLHTAAAQLLMIKDGLAENIIYNIKYKNATQLATQLGEQYGRTLSKSPIYQEVDLIVPVPLHKSKYKTRGYNQSAMYGQGLAESMNIPMVEDALIKKRKTKSQTRKSRMNRLLSVQGEYGIDNSDSIRGKHVLLVDDVLTTGATIESCALELLKVEGVRVSVVTIAFKNY